MAKFVLHADVIAAIILNLS
jgi:hypothetical protein